MQKDWRLYVYYEMTTNLFELIWNFSKLAIKLCRFEVMTNSYFAAYEQKLNIFFILLNSVQQIKFDTNH